MRLDGLRRERANASGRYADGQFRNTHPRARADLAPGTKRGGVMREFMFGRSKRRPPGAIPVGDPREAWTRPIGASRFRATWLGHSTMLLELDGLRVLTDPVFGDRLGPIPLVGPRRFHAPPVTVAQLPALDAIVISHDHFDHLCADTARELARATTAPIVTSLGVGVYLEQFGVPAERIVELDWWESHALRGGDLAITAAPAQHFSGRLTGRNATAWSSWVIETAGHKVFFSGDTGLTPEFHDIGARLGPFDLTMLEIGAWHPAWGSIHLGPANALAAFDALGGGTLLPVHWATFDLGLHAWAAPGEELVALAAARGARILTPALGAPFEPAALEGPTPWWRSVGAAVVETEVSDASDASDASVSRGADSTLRPA